MITDPYNPKVREYFARAEHCGDLDNAATGYFADQGISIRLSAKFKDGTITALRFRAWGCPHVIAASEAVCRQFEGRPIVELEQFETAQIMLDLAVPVEKTGRILVLEDTVRSLGQAIRDQLSPTQD